MKNFAEIDCLNLEILEYLSFLTGKRSFYIKGKTRSERRDWNTKLFTVFSESCIGGKEWLTNCSNENYKVQWVSKVKIGPIHKYVITQISSLNVKRNTSQTMIILFLLDHQNSEAFENGLFYYCSTSRSCAKLAQSFCEFAFFNKSGRKQASYGLFCLKKQIHHNFEPTLRMILLQ